MLCLKVVLFPKITQLLLLGVMQAIYRSESSGTSTDEGGIKHKDYRPSRFVLNNPKPLQFSRHILITGFTAHSSRCFHFPGLEIICHLRTLRTHQASKFSCISMQQAHVADLSHSACNSLCMCFISLANEFIILHEMEQGSAIAALMTDFQTHLDLA